MRVNRDQLESYLHKRKNFTSGGFFESVQPVVYMQLPNDDLAQQDCF